MNEYFNMVGNYKQFTPAQEYEFAEELFNLILSFWKTILEDIELRPVVLNLIAEYTEGSTDDWLSSLSNEEIEPNLIIEQDKNKRLLKFAFSFFCNTNDYPFVLAKIKEIRTKKNHFICHYLPLVVSVARNTPILLKKGGFQFADLIQEGNIGLIRAIDSFDHRKGHRFTTYASWWIRSMMWRSYKERSSVVLTPINVVEKRAKINRAVESFYMQYGKEPTLEELIDLTEMDRKTIERVRGCYVESVVSLDCPVGEEEESVFIDLIVDESADDPEKIVIGESERKELNRFLAMLNERERDIILYRFGFKGAPDGCTLSGLGLKLELSRERVRQVQEIALKKMKIFLRDDNSVLKKIG